MGNLPFSLLFVQCIQTNTLYSVPYCIIQKEKKRMFKFFKVVKHIMT